MEPSEIRGQIDTILQSDSYRNTFSPDHLQTQEKIQALYAELYPDETPNEQTPPPSETEPKAAETEPKAEETPEEDPFGVPAAEMDNLQDLRSEWGSDFDRNLAQAQGLAAEYAKTYGNEFVEWLETSRAGSHPLIIKSFHAWANNLQGPEVSPSEARELVKVLRSGEYYGRGNSKMHDVLKDVVGRLYEIGYEG
jgi:hypothetical protein